MSAVVTARSAHLVSQLRNQDCVLEEASFRQEVGERVSVTLAGQPGLAPLGRVQLRVVPQQAVCRLDAAAFGAAADRVAIKCGLARVHSGGSSSGRRGESSGALPSFGVTGPRAVPPRDLVALATTTAIYGRITAAMTRHQPSTVQW